MRFTDLYIIDPIMSIGVAVFILLNAFGNLKKIVDLFLEKTPEGILVEDIKRHLLEIEGVADVHHIHIRSLDGHLNYATMHVVANGDSHLIKEKAREELQEHGIAHCVLELEEVGEHCHGKSCTVEREKHSCHHHHH